MAAVLSAGDPGAAKSQKKKKPTIKSKEVKVSQKAVPSFCNSLKFAAAAKIFAERLSKIAFLSLPLIEAPFPPAVESNSYRKKFLE